MKCLCVWVEAVWKITLQAIHTDAVIKTANSQERNIVLDDSFPALNGSEKDLTMRERALPSPSLDLGVSNSWTSTRVG